MTPTSYGLIVFERLVLGVGTLMRTMIALRTLYDPNGLTLPLGIALKTPTAITVVRVGFGGFPLGVAIALLSCLTSIKRLLAGVSVVAVLMAGILVARIQGLIVGGVTVYNLARLPPEVTMLTLSLVAVVLERRRRQELVA
jgi:hypothetical protein